MYKSRQVDICFILDATSSNQSIFNLVYLFFEDVIFDVRISFRIPYFEYSAVVYRDPIDYRPIPSEISDMLKEEKSKEKLKIIEKLKEADLYDKDFEDEKMNITKFYDKDAFPIDKNVFIPFTDEIENLISELSKVECGGGDDEPEDWVGALNLALNELEWRKRSKKIIVWISDSNAHGKRFCGFDNHNEEEIKMNYLVEMIANREINFLGINLIKNNKGDGCEKTLNEMKKIYDECASKSGQSKPLNFLIHNFKVDYDESVYGEDNWPGELMEKLYIQLSQQLKNMIELFEF